MSKKSTSKKKPQPQNKIAPQNESENNNQPFVRTLELIFKHNIVFWLLFFPPVAIYRLFKYKILNKVFTIALAIFMSLLLLVSIYTVIHPTTAVDETLSIQMKNMGYGKIRDVTYIGKYDTYLSSEVITSTGYYYVYYHINDESKLEIDAILELVSEMNSSIGFNQFETKYKSDNASNLLTIVNPAAIKFIIQNSDYGIIEEVIDDGVHEQVFQTNKGVFKFKYSYYETINIQELKNNTYVDVMNRDYVINFKEEFQKALEKEKFVKVYYEVNEIITYGITSDSIYYIFTNFCGNTYRIVKYDNGKIDIDVAVDINPVSQKDLAATWQEYQEIKNAQ